MSFVMLSWRAIKVSFPFPSGKLQSHLLMSLTCFPHRDNIPYKIARPVLSHAKESSSLLAVTREILGLYWLFTEMKNRR